MCTPDFASMLQNNQSAVTLGLGGIGGALKMSSAMSASNNAITADNTQADVASTNALISERAAASAITSGQEQASNTFVKGAQVRAAQTAAMAANGVDVTPGASGTADNVRAATQWQTSADANTITANAARAAMGYTQQSVNAANQAGALRAAAAANSPGMAGFTSLLGSATSVASDWYRNQRAGVN